MGNIQHNVLLEAFIKILKHNIYVVLPKHVSVFLALFVLSIPQCHKGANAGDFPGGPNAGSLGCIPGQGPRSCMPQLKILHATTIPHVATKSWHSQIKK